MDQVGAHPGKVKVFCEIKVASASKSSIFNSMSYSDGRNLKMQYPEPLSASASKAAEKKKKEISYAFERIHVNRASHELYKQVAYPAVKGLFFEDNALLLVHGLNNSNKNLLLHGDPVRSSHAGIFKRILETLFYSISDCQNGKYLLKSTGPSNKFVLQDSKRIQFDHLLEKKFKQHPFRSHLRSKFTADSNPKSLQSDYVYCVPLNCQEDEGTSRYSVFISCMELHNDVLYDLLEPFNPSNKTEPAKIKLQEKKAIETRRATRFKTLNQIEKSEIEVANVAEALELIHDANSLRFVDFNDESKSKSRSHFIVEFKLVKIETSKTTGHIEFKVAQLCVCDLAACEKQMDELNAIYRAKEKRFLNGTLLSLRTCLEAVKFNSLYPFYKKPVKTNESVLTSLLEPFFQANDDAIQMLLCINSDNSCFQDNCNVLKFANLVPKSYASTPSVSSYSSAMSAASLANQHPTGLIHTPMIPQPSNSTSQVDSRIANQVSQQSSQAPSSVLNDELSFPDATAASRMRHTVNDTESDADHLADQDIKKLEESYSSIVSSITCMENLDVENEESLSNLIKALVNHEAYRNSMIKRMGYMVNRVREEIKELHQQHDELKSDTTDCKSAMSKVEAKLESNQRKLDELKFEVNRMMGHNSRRDNGLKPPAQSFKTTVTPIRAPPILLNSQPIQSNDPNNNDEICYNLNYNLKCEPYMVDLESESDDYKSSDEYEHITHRPKNMRRSRSAGVKSRVDADADCESRYEHLYSNDTNSMGLFSPKTRARLLRL